MNLFLHGQEDFEIVRGDTLREPKFLIYDRLETFDCVIANPPFSLSEWGHEQWAADAYRINLKGESMRKRVKKLTTPGTSG